MLLAFSSRRRDSAAAKADRLPQFVLTQEPIVIALLSRQVLLQNGQRTRIAHAAERPRGGFRSLNV
jgi:hypothetical protein